MKISISLMAICMGLMACVQEMGFLGRLLPYGSIDKKPVARTIPEHTIAQGQLKRKSDYDQMPMPLTKDMLERGRERYDIYCAVCHGLSGFGDGVIVERGFSAPPSFHQERLRMAPPQYLANVIRNGFGAMYGYSDQISLTDSLVIVGYIRALQLSQNVILKNLPDIYRQDILRELK